MTAPSRETATGAPEARAGDRPAGLVHRLATWAGERFPPASALLFLALHLAAAGTARALAGLPGPALRPGDLRTFPAVWAFFLTLRILDEHKDLSHDAVHHPERPVPRGLVTLGELRAVAALAVGLQIGTSLGADLGADGSGGAVGGATAAWLATAAWTALMTVEFFAGERLRRRPLLYAASHLLVLPLAALWMARLAVPEGPLPVGLAGFAALAFATGAAFEVARKTRAPSEERLGVPSYTKSLGTRRASLVLLGLVALEAALAAGLLAAARELPALSLPVLAAAVGAAAAVLLRFRREPTPARARGIEPAAAGATLAIYAVLLVSLAAGTA